MLIITILASVVYASLAEYLLHRFMMHRPFFGFDYAFNAHAKVHHHIFKADHTYHLIDTKDKRTIPMAWWNSIVLTILFTFPTIPLSFMLHWYISPIVYLTLWAYYGAYEYLHWCMHLPKARRVEKSWIFYRLNGHHLLHHRYQGKNYNVVLPIIDLLAGTLVLRSQIRFPQARGPSVPDVQPHHKDRWSP